MDPLAAANHLLNFAAPALGVSLLLAAAGRVFYRKSPHAAGFIGEFAINLIVGVVVLGAGLVLFGRDGKMLTYAALAAACGTSQWLMLRGWRR
ncbi:hypothetical protein [Paracidovorax konjaci]|uniref:Uncharacterized protein n=1 Tax=Paracidovorax konjaci TaxID=32040 RepID=A0A1I1YX01_9BURK|nr:hypothetical protein [Paracidovorax konjaci]SFE24086.1 hypothetical protein SAMN04489710_12118 [Paracidovorax konjaci]